MRQRYFEVNTYRCATDQKNKENNLNKMERKSLKITIQFRQTDVNEREE